MAGHEVGKNEVLDLASQGRISFELMAEALESMTRKGGIFEDQMTKQSNTLIGIFSTLKDNVFLALNSIGEKLVSVFKIKSKAKELIKWIGQLTERFNAFAEANPQATKWILIFAATLAVLGPVIIGLGLVVTAIGAIISPIGLAVLALLALAGVVAVVITKWDSIKAYFKGLWQDVLSGFEQGLITGLVNAILAFNPMRLMLDGINALVDMLFGVNLYDIGNAWVSSLGDGIAAAWRDLVAWLSGKVDDLLSVIPDAVKDFLGLDVVRYAGDAPPSAFSSDTPSALPSGGYRNTFGGAVRVSFDNAPANMQVREVRSDNADVGIDVDAGYAIAGH